MGVIINGEDEVVDRVPIFVREYDTFAAAEDATPLNQIVRIGDGGAWQRDNNALGDPLVPLSVHPDHSKWTLLGSLHGDYVLQSGWSTVTDGAGSTPTRVSVLGRYYWELRTSAPLFVSDLSKIQFAYAWQPSVNYRFVIEVYTETGENPLNHRIMWASSSRSQQLYVDLALSGTSSRLYDSGASAVGLSGRAYTTPKLPLILDIPATQTGTSSVSISGSDGHTEAAAQADQFSASPGSDLFEIAAYADVGESAHVLRIRSAALYART